MAFSAIHKRLDDWKVRISRGSRNNKRSLINEQGGYVVFLVLTPNTNAPDSTLVCPVKMEYGPENNIFVLKMMMKSGIEKLF